MPHPREGRNCMAVGWSMSSTSYANPTKCTALIRIPLFGNQVYLTRAKVDKTYIIGGW